NFKPYELLCNLFIKVINFLSNIRIGLIEVPSLNSFHIMSYYISIFFLFAKRKFIYLIIIIFVVFMKGKITIGGYVKILDVGQGDTSLIKTNKYMIMIDCFNDSYKYLQKEGINHIDYLIVTHGHNDHAEDLMDIYYSNIKVDTLIVSFYDDSSYINEACSYYKNVLRFKANDEINLDKLNIKCLAPTSNNSNLNNISLVLKIRVLNKDFLFMGDYELEETLLNSNIKCDILKVGHHGAKYAFTKAFIDKCNPSMCVISCGAYNKYNHPSDVWIDYFNKNKIKYHITYIDKTYTYRKFFV
nr:MBL fold metallo-hydrolase [bacterium]